MSRQLALNPGFFTQLPCESGMLSNIWKLSLLITHMCSDKARAWHSENTQEIVATFTAGILPGRVTVLVHFLCRDIQKYRKAPSRK